jgi:hypothetical protein
MNREESLAAALRECLPYFENAQHRIINDFWRSVDATNREASAALKRAAEYRLLLDVVKEQT